MWDLGGQDSLRAAWNTYYTDTEVRDSFKDVKDPLINDVTK